MTIETPRMHPFEPPVDFVDPRVCPDFDPRHWPLCDGRPAAPPGTTELHERRCIEFLAAFYRINVLSDRLLAAQLAGATDSALKSIRDEIAAATVALETMEDRYAPIGFFGEPVMDEQKKMRYNDIVFVRPEIPRVYPKASALSSHFAIPGLDEIPESELRGPVKIVRFGHGKVDL
jgi:hypothetical protein